MKTTKKILAAVAVLSTTSGCALTNPEGFEFGAKLGMYATHEHSESTKTVSSPCRGLKAWVVGCGNVAPTSEVSRGS